MLDYAIPYQLTENEIKANNANEADFEAFISSYLLYIQVINARSKSEYTLSQHLYDNLQAIQVNAEQTYSRISSAEEAAYDLSRNLINHLTNRNEQVSIDILSNIESICDSVSNLSASLMSLYNAAQNLSISAHSVSASLNSSSQSSQRMLMNGNLFLSKLQNKSTDESTVNSLRLARSWNDNTLLNAQSANSMATTCNSTCQLIQELFSSSQQSLDRLRDLVNHCSNQINQY